MKKILTIEKLKTLKKLKKKIVLCHGVFDLVHSGHIKYFQEAKKRGDILIVSVTDDKFVNKGPGRPLFKINDRIAVLNSIEHIDYLHISKNFTSENILNYIKPNIYCKGKDYKNKLSKDKNLKKEVDILKKNKGKFVIIDQLLKSSSNVINKSNLLFDDNTNIFLNKIRKKYSLPKIINELNKLKNLSVFVLGEIIVDEYIFTEAVGKSGKESMLVLEKKSENKFLGGAGYTANLLSNFVKKIRFCSFVGTDKKEVNFIKKKINNKILFNYFTKTNTTNFSKSRFVDLYSKNKIIGVYKLNDEEISKKQEKLFINGINKFAKKYDVIVVSDYGHGVFTNLVRKTIQKYSNKLFLNTQINSFNRGYHTLFKYKNLNTLVINESELRYELRDKKSELKFLAKEISKKLIVKNVIITRGRFGAQLYKNNKIIESPAFNLNTLDTMGAGDTFLSLIAICLKSKMDIDLSMLIASLGASHSTQKIGHSDILTLDHIERSLNYLFK